MISKIYITLLSACLVTSNAFGNAEVEAKQEELETQKQIEADNARKNGIVNGINKRLSEASNNFTSMGSAISESFKKASDGLNADKVKLSEVRAYLVSSLETLSNSKATDTDILEKIDSILTRYPNMRTNCNSLQYQVAYRNAGASITTLSDELERLDHDIEKSFEQSTFDQQYVDKVSSVQDNLRETLSEIRTSFESFPMVRYPPVCVDLYKIPEILGTARAYAKAIADTDVSLLKALKNTIGDTILQIRNQQRSLDVLDEFNVVVTSLETKVTQSTRYGNFKDIASIDESLVATKRIMELGLEDLTLSDKAKSQYLGLISKIDISLLSLSEFKVDLEGLKTALYRRVKNVSRTIRLALRNGPVAISPELLTEIGIDPKTGRIVEILKPTSFDDAVKAASKIAIIEENLEGVR